MSGIDPAGGVYSGPQTKSHCAHGYLAFFHSGYFTQRPDADALHFIQFFQTELSHYSVFAHQRHHVCYGSQGYQIKLILKKRLILAAGVTHQRLSQLKGQADSCQSIERVTGILQLRIQRDQRGGKFVPGFVVICDDHVYAGFIGNFYLFHRAYAAVHRDHQAAAFFL